MATQIVPAPVRADHQASEMSPADRMAHDDSTHVTWRAREKYLRGLNVNGHIRTAGDRLLANMAGRWALIEVTVEYVSPASPDGAIVLVVAGRDRRGEALVQMDSQDRAEALDWMDRDYASLLGQATVLYGQPALDLRRATLAHPQPATAAA
ncbi:hypothetical protein [Streptomyces mirabilis]|uniref:hypothetical protein n=1 Tax=Streptomyces mirabilis TaxID=68239 RepID=UPI0033FB5117